MWVRGFQHLGTGGSYISIGLLELDTMNVQVDSMVYGTDYDGYTGYAVFGTRSYDFAADVDSTLLADDPLNAQIFNPMAQSRDSLGHMMVPDYVIHRGIPTLKHGEYYFVLLNGAFERSAYFDPAFAATGHWEGLPCKRPAKIVRLQYRGE